MVLIQRKHIYFCVKYPNVTSWWQYTGKVWKAIGNHCCFQLPLIISQHIPVTTLLNLKRDAQVAELQSPSISPRCFTFLSFPASSGLGTAMLVHGHCSGHGSYLMCFFLPFLFFFMMSPLLLLPVPLPCFSFNFKHGFFFFPFLLSFHWFIPPYLPLLFCSI